MALKYRDVERALTQAGWTRVRMGKGSHEVWVSPEGVQVTLASGGKRNRQVPVGTLANIRRTTGMKELR